MKARQPWPSLGSVAVVAGGVMLHFPSARVEADGGPASSEALTRLYPAVEVNVGWAF